MSRIVSAVIIQQIEKSDKKTDVDHPDNGVNQLQTLKYQSINNLTSENVINQESWEGNRTETKRGAEPLERPPALENRMGVLRKNHIHETEIIEYIKFGQ